MEQPKTIRCAIYTRKSTDEGLNMEFNTLEAQREAGENYIRSQAYQGWVSLPERYDDGGYSGGSLERPALQRLLADVKADKIDMIVIYKIDRLTRSLLDFSQLIRVLDEHHCSFVAVTQNFNTYDSMGRLTLNILLSFAQFERELDSERIRDKIKASKQKGIWMGGAVPLGYEVKDRKLEIVDEEAKIVKLIFEKYRDYRSMRIVAQYLRDNHILNRSRYHRNTGKNERLPFTSCSVGRIIINPIYAGKLSYKGELHEGVHEAIIPYEEWKEIQKIKDTNFKRSTQISRRYGEAMLKSLLVTGDGKYRFMAYHAKKGSVVHHYYAVQAKVREGKDYCDIRNIPMAELDTFILQKIIRVLRSPLIVDELTRQMANTPVNAGIFEIVKALDNTDLIIKKLSPEARRHLVILMVKEIRLNPDNVVIVFTKEGSKLLLTTRGKTPSESDELVENEQMICPINLRKKSGQVKLIAEGMSNTTDTVLLKALYKAHAWQKALMQDNMTMQQLSQKEKISRRYMAKMIRLTALAPDIIEAIYQGTQPESLTLTRLLNCQIPVLWSEQRKVFNINCK
jgi:DNA invertase Pin-like site-specific DNA recombinase